VTARDGERVFICEAEELLPGGRLVCGVADRSIGLSMSAGASTRCTTGVHTEAVPSAWGR
jgi:uncharacterized protein (DUF169 family)